ncbi:tetratricopeptide repeat protein 1 [Stigmatopora nigra]
MNGPADEVKHNEEDALEREDFFDCQETLEKPNRGDEDSQRLKTEARQRSADTFEEEDDDDSDIRECEEVAAAPAEEEEGEELTEEEEQSRRMRSLALKEEGNSYFKQGDWSAAEQSYTRALRLCPCCFAPERAVLFSNRAAARLRLERKEDGIADCSKALELNPDYVKALLRRAELYEQTEQLEKALEDYGEALRRDPELEAAKRACARLPQEIHDKNEKLKEEMLGKLKELGNMVLRPFGLSTNNFRVDRNADTGSYSVNFVNKSDGT